MPKPQNTDLAYLIREAIRSRVACIHTSAPGVVRSYDRERQCASVQLVVRGRRIDPRTQERSTYQHRPIVNVPVQFSGNAESGITFDLAKGDPVLVVFAERDISRWLASGSEDNEPVDPRRHDLSDAFCIPGVFPFSGSTRPENATADGAAVFYGDDIRLGSADASDFLALASLVEARLAAIESWMSSFKTWADLHVHGVAGTPPLSPLSPGAPDLSASVASSKVRSE